MAVGVRKYTELQLEKLGTPCVISDFRVRVNETVSLFRNVTQRKLLAIYGRFWAHRFSRNVGNQLEIQRFVISRRYMNAPFIFVPPVVMSCSERLFSPRVSSLSLAVLIW